MLPDGRVLVGGHAPIGTATSRVHRGRRLLRRLLADPGEIDRTLKSGAEGARAGFCADRGEAYAGRLRPQLLWAERSQRLKHDAIPHATVRGERNAT